MQKRFQAWSFFSGFVLAFAIMAAANDWQWHSVGSIGGWGHSASYSVLSSSGSSSPFSPVIGVDATSYGGFIFPYDRRVMRTLGDFDGDGKSDCWYYHPSQVWYLIYSSTTQVVDRLAFGLPNATPVPEDYDGDHLSDYAVYQASSGMWIVLLSSLDYASASTIFGGPGHIPIPGDFDGDQKADPAVYNQLTGVWTVMMSASGYRQISGGFGGSGFTAVVGDFDEDDKCDPIAYNEAIGSVSILMSGSGYLPLAGGFGGPGATLLVDDYDGDGCVDLAAYQRNSGLWYIINYKIEWLACGKKWGGGAGYQPITGDYDGDGLADVAAFYRDTKDSIWYLDETTDGPQTMSARGGRPKY